ncbi:hypothetical protein [Erwinia tracheiphila]|uniref:hypothetical protein n=1 Tax=Erwinia tracheiphila TaxID=65700 RepID=UPI00128C1171|nr:hypothetical protein [Erwinia tracheiphila]
MNQCKNRLTARFWQIVRILMIALVLVQSEPVFFLVVLASWQKNRMIYAKRNNYLYHSGRKMNYLIEVNDYRRQKVDQMVKKVIKEKEKKR